MSFCGISSSNNNNYTKDHRQEIGCQCYWVSFPPKSSFAYPDIQDLLTNILESRQKGLCDYVSELFCLLNGLAVMHIEIQK
jgi:hypothetical protein